jgi:alpha-galactosidase
MGVADAIAASGLRDAGYTFVNMDDCWQINRTENGVIIPDPEKFPSGLTNLISYVHSKGLKFGWYCLAAAGKADRQTDRRVGGWTDGTDRQTDRQFFK